MEVVSIYAFYIDVFWLNLFLMNGTILLLAGRVQGKTYIRQWFKCFASAGIGSTVSVVVLLSVKNYQLFWLCQVLGIIPGMVRLAFGKCLGKVFLRMMFLCYGITILMGGVNFCCYGGDGNTKFLFSP